MVDGLATVLSKANTGAGAPPYLEGVTHLQYADDTTILVEPSDLGIDNLKLLLICFGNMPGLKFNFDKSEG
jgi:hypothetical protein